MCTSLSFQVFRSRMKALVVSVICLIILAPDIVRTTPEQGLWNVEVTKDHNQATFSKSLYEGSTIKVKLACTNADKNATNKLKLAVGFAGKMTQCQDEFRDIDDPRLQDYAYIYAASEQIIDGERVMYFVDQTQDWYDCDGSYIILKDHSTLDWITIIAKDTTSADSDKISEEVETVDSTTTPTPATTPAISVAKSKDSKKPDKPDKRHKADGTNTKNGLHQIAVAKEDGIYLFAFVFACAYYKQNTNTIHIDTSLECDFNVALTVEMHHERFGYLSAIDWPLLPFYATMCAVYSLYTISWIILCICYWRDLLRLQFWIAGVILLGLVEKLIFLAQYQSVFFSGLSVLPGAVVIAEIVSALERTLARILIVIVSVGFGIVRPRLGPIFKRVLIIGGFYFVCASVQGCLCQLKLIGELLRFVFPLVLMLIDAILFCWIFKSLVHTIRQLRVRRNVVKLALYKHFTFVLISAVLASLVYMVWSSVDLKFVKCLVHWKELWMDEAFWQMRYSAILLVIIILFRPSNTTGKNALQLLLDADKEGEEGSKTGEVVVTNLANDVKKNLQENGKMHSNAKSEYDDLKGVEDNILATEGVLISLLNSDEEIVASKMYPMVS